MNVVLGMLCGCLLGGCFVYYCFRRSLTLQEWIYLRSFLDALRRGAYVEHANDEGSEDDGEQD